MTDTSDKSDKDRDYKPHGIVGRMTVKPPIDKHFRRSKRYEPEQDTKSAEIKPEVIGINKVYNQK